MRKLEVVTKSFGGGATANAAAPVLLGQGGLRGTSVRLVAMVPPFTSQLSVLT